ncbi:uncharacterized protein C8R40DRAFT_1065326 [Lentinula edodes]|uniref:uncharacterized protein n=1 Tax=Lentinula edodes TaxID=5353 RepID=UPI001E8DDAF9|nr:uncharacterized protein C8R40DRAFT_1065326 [Lentinula edodes]KAH7880226.1 hypothetical protein C8R40DRAFT_1065326 [Lentinula edodes]
MNLIQILSKILFPARIAKLWKKLALTTLDMTVSIQPSGVHSTEKSGSNCMTFVSAQKVFIEEMTYAGEDSLSPSQPLTLQDAELAESSRSESLTVSSRKNKNKKIIRTMVAVVIHKPSKSSRSKLLENSVISTRGSLDTTEPGVDSKTWGKIINHDLNSEDIGAAGVLRREDVGGKLGCWRCFGKSIWESQTNIPLGYQCGMHFLGEKVTSSARPCTPAAGGRRLQVRPSAQRCKGSTNAKDLNSE